jgi:hypothetical protein
VKVKQLLGWPRGDSGSSLCNPSSSQLAESLPLARVSHPTSAHLGGGRLESGGTVTPRWASYHFGHPLSFPGPNLR